MLPKNSEIRPLVATWMGRETITLSETSQIEKDKYLMISLICENLKMIYINFFTKQRLTNIESKLMVTQGERWGGEG